MKIKATAPVKKLVNGIVSVKNKMDTLSEKRTKLEDRLKHFLTSKKMAFNRKTGTVDPAIEIDGYALLSDVHALKKGADVSGMSSLFKKTTVVSFRKNPTRSQLAKIKKALGDAYSDVISVDTEYEAKPEFWERREFDPAFRKETEVICKAARLKIG